MSRVLRPRGAANSLSMLILGSVIVVLVLISYLVISTSKKPGGDVDEMFVFCAAGMRYPMDRIASDYEREYGVAVEVQYGGSNTLLSQLEVGKTGDLYLAADDSYIQLAQKKGLAAEVLPLATMRPVIAVRKDSKKKLESLDDLLADGVRIGCGNPDAAAIGKTTRRLLEQSGHWKRLEKQIHASGVFKPTVNEVANDVKLGSVDAGIIWDTTAAQYPEIKAIRVPELDEGTASVEITVLNSAKNGTAALRFARYVAARDKGLKAFADAHFEVVEGDIWEEVPEMTFFAGSVNRRALGPIIKAFEEREGVKINTVYNGCGILTGQMRVMAKNQESGFPDTYMACDVYYLETVKDWFQEAVNVSDTDIVIAVQEGNPKGIKSLKDLLKPGMRVAIGQPDQCTIGALTRRLLQDAGIYDELRKNNVVTETETSALLVPAVTTKSADAALAYQTDTLAESDKVDVIKIDTKLSKAIQPFSIARSSKQKYLARRLFKAISKSRESFETVGFHWRLDSDADSSSPAPTESP